MTDKKNNQTEQNKSGTNDDLDDLKQFLIKNKKQKQVLKKILKKINQFKISDKTSTTN